MGSTLLSRYLLAETTDAAELLPHVHQTFGLNRIKPVGPVPQAQRYELRGLSEPTFTVGFIRGAGVRVDSGTMGGSYFVNLGISGAVRSQRGEERLINCPDVAAVYNPGDTQLLLPEPESETLVIRLERELVARELQSLLGHELDAPVRFDFALDLARTDVQGLRIVINNFLAQLDADVAVLQHPQLRLHQIRSFVAGLLLSHQHSYSDELASGQSPVRPRTLRRALDFIDANLADPMSLGDIAAAAGCSARRLTESFREHLGVAPMTRVRQLRLDRVHADLQGGDGPVTEVALRWGFGHLGRFAGMYHERFGELPSETVRRG